MLVQAKRMQKRAYRKDGHQTIVPVGTVVQLVAANVDRAKTDVANITAIVVEHVHTEELLQYRVAALARVLKGVYSRHQLKPLTTPPDLLGLDLVMTGWPRMPLVGERACMRVVSAVGGQGMVHCTCTGKCLTNRCACRKAKRLCNSRCHRRSVSCRNFEGGDDDV